MTLCIVIVCLIVVAVISFLVTERAFYKDLAESYKKFGSEMEQIAEDLLKHLGHVNDFNSELISRIEEMSRRGDWNEHNNYSA